MFNVIRGKRLFIQAAIGYIPNIFNSRLDPKNHKLHIDLPGMGETHLLPQECSQQIISSGQGLALSESKSHSSKTSPSSHGSDRSV
jgi:hypothetical protein